jgi:O-methyltransferase involved in polyketide biosynthesis
MLGSQATEEGQDRLMTGEQVRFTGERETLLITLYGRALQSRRVEPILRDEWAEAAVDRLDYDFAKLKMSESDSLAIAARAREFDMLTARFIAAHPTATVLHLGCGLDSRVLRVEPPESVCWFDVDYPDVIELRRRLFPLRSGYRMIGTSLADVDWIRGLPGDQPVFVVAEGVTMYLTEHIVKSLLQAVVEHFPSGEVAFDVHNRRLVGFTTRARADMKGNGASFGWGIDDPREITTLVPRLKLIAQTANTALDGYSMMPAAVRARVRLMNLVPALRSLNRVLRYGFKPTDAQA